MLARARGEISLWLVAVMMAGFAAIAMAALFSMRYERNVFAEAINAVLKSPVAAASISQARDAAGGGARAGSANGAAPQGALRKCVSGTQTVVSNVDCPRGSSSKVIPIVDTRGIEPPKAAPVPQAPAATLQEKTIEKMSR